MESVSEWKASDGVLPESSSFILHCCQLTKSHKTAKFQSCPTLGMTLFPLVTNCKCKRMTVMWLDLHCYGFLNTFSSSFGRWKVKFLCGISHWWVWCQTCFLSCKSFVLSTVTAWSIRHSSVQLQSSPKPSYFPPAPQLLQSWSVVAGSSSPRSSPRPQLPNSEQDSVPLLETWRR